MEAILITIMTYVDLPTSRGVRACALVVLVVVLVSGPRIRVCEEMLDHDVHFIEAPVFYMVCVNRESINFCKSTIK